jgi:sugar lactone lactonase YvrE
MALDRPGGLLYVADTGAGRVMRLDTATGTPGGPLDGWDGGSYSAMTGGAFERFVDGLGQPSGLLVDGGRIFVADHASGEIIAFASDGHELGRLATGAPGVMGIRIGPDHKLWFVDGDHDRVVRVDP